MNSMFTTVALLVASFLSATAYGGAEFAGADGSTTNEATESSAPTAPPPENFAGATEGPPSVQRLANKVMDTFGFKFQLVWDISFNCSAESNWADHKVTLCTREAQAYKGHLSGQEILQNYQMTLLHEVSHFLVATNPGHQVSLDWDFDEKLSKTTHLPSQEIGRRRAILAHENVDALAGKLAGQFGVKINGYVKSFAVIARDPALSNDDRQAVRELAPGRILALKTSYTEGWNHWSNFHAVSPICDDNLLRNFLRKNSHSSLLKTIGTSNCETLPLQESVSALQKPK